MLSHYVGGCNFSNSPTRIAAFARAFYPSGKQESDSQ